MRKFTVKQKRDELFFSISVTYPSAVPPQVVRQFRWPKQVYSPFIWVAGRWQLIVTWRGRHTLIRVCILLIQLQSSLSESTTPLSEQIRLHIWKDLTNILIFFCQLLLTVRLDLVARLTPLKSPKLWYVCIVLHVIFEISKPNEMNSYDSFVQKKHV